MHMKKLSFLKAGARLFIALFVLQALGAKVLAQNAYETGFATIVRLTADLQQAVDRQQRPGLSPTPVLLENLPIPYLQMHLVDATKGIRAVHVSKGLVDLLNFISHAKAIDAANHGFFTKSMARL